MSNAPLEDPDYEPEHPPVNGQIPDVVAKFGKDTQLRWFNRFRGQLGSGINYNPYYCNSLHHLGPCCVSCVGEYEDGDGSVIEDGWCCCQDKRVYENMKGSQA
jgi:hypothetical protein